MNYTPEQWYEIALSGAFGFDKSSLADRLLIGDRIWLDYQRELINPHTADEPAYALAMLDGLNGNHRVRVHLDATASGTQILAAFANCRKSGTHCNLFGEARQDAYTNAWQAMGLTEEIDRKDAKAAFMTAGFGSKAVPRERLGEHNLPAFYRMYQTEFPGVWNVLRYLENLWQPNVHSHRWTMPDGFEVIQWNTGIEDETVTLFGQPVTVQKQVKVTQKRGISLMANVTHATDGFICREMVKRAAVNPGLAEVLLLEGFPAVGGVDESRLVQLYRKTGFLSIDLIRHLSQATYNRLSPAEKTEIVFLLEHLAQKQQFHLVPVHDSFSCEARYCNDMCHMYRYLMQQLWDSTLLDSIAEDITGVREHHTKHPAVLDGVHMIC